WPDHRLHHVLGDRRRGARAVSALLDHDRHRDLPVLLLCVPHEPGVGRAVLPPLRGAVLPPTSTPSIAAAVPVPSSTTPTIIFRIWAAFAALSGWPTSFGVSSATVDRSLVRTAWTSCGCMVTPSLA